MSNSSSRGGALQDFNAFHYLGEKANYYRYDDGRLAISASFEIDEENQEIDWDNVDELPSHHSGPMFAVVKFQFDNGINVGSSLKFSGKEYNEEGKWPQTYFYDCMHCHLEDGEFEIIEVDGDAFKLAFKISGEWAGDRGEMWFYPTTELEDLWIPS